MFRKRSFALSLLIIAAALGMLLILENTPLALRQYQDVLVHSFLFLLVTAVIFFVCFYSYQRYVKEKEIRWYILSLTFFLRGVIAFAHAISVPAFGWGDEVLFGISEHYGLFLLSFFLWGLVVPFSKKLQEKLFQWRTAVFFCITFFLLAGLAFPIFSPALATFLLQNIPLFSWLSGASLFAILLVLLACKEEDFFTMDFTKVLALLAVTAVIPFFYEEWNAIWWYDHLIWLAVPLLLLFFLWRKRGRTIAEVLFSSFSVRTRLFFVVGLTLAAIIVNGAIDFRLLQNHIKIQTAEHLLSVTELQEGRILSYLDTLKNRAVDFSSDGFIRENLQKVFFGNQEAAPKLNDHLSQNKQPLDPMIFGISVIDENGRVIASTAGSEIGKSFATDALFVSAKNSGFAHAVLSDIREDQHFGKRQTVILAASPVFEQTRSKAIGVIVLFFQTSGLEGLLADARLAQEKTFELYLVNKKNILLSGSSRIAADRLFKLQTDTLPIRACRASRNMSGEYRNEKGISVFGASTCFANGWVLFAEVDRAEIFSSLGNLYRQNMISLGVTFLFIFFAIYLFILGITSPLKELSIAARKISEGDFAARVKLLTRDEFGALSTVFNQMAHNIQIFSADLQQKVREERKSRLTTTRLLKDLEIAKDRAETLATDLKKFKLAVDDASDQIIITDPDGIVIYVNKVIERVTGYTPEEVIGKKSGALWKMPMPKEYYQNLWDTIKNRKKTFYREIQNRRKNGEVYVAALSISPVLDKEGNILYFVGIERDITKEKDIDRAKTEFVALASHQLRTPLSAINWYTELLLSGSVGPMNDEQKSYVDEVYKGNRRMIELVNALLHVSRLELGTFAVEPEPTDIVALTHEVIEELQQSIKGKRLVLSEMQKEALPLLNVDPKLFRMVFQNLFSNAIKYTPEKGRIAFSFSLDTKKKGIVFQISDTGCGIPKHQQDKIFTKLFRADNVRKLDTEGTGLGLYIVKLIIDHAGGKIWFESEEGKGTTFYITLPLKGMKKKNGTQLV